MFLPKNESTSFEIAPAGTYTAICHRFIDLGTQEQVYQGEHKIKRLVMIGFELPTELTSDGRPFTIHKRYTWSMNEKSTLRKDLESWRGKKFADTDFGEGGFDIRKILGVGATITITHSENDNRTYSNIASIGAMMKGVEKPKLTNNSVYVALVEDEFDETAFDGLSDNLKETIRKSPEYVELTGGYKTENSYGAQKQNGISNAGNASELDDEIPFG